MTSAPARTAPSPSTPPSATPTTPPTITATRASRRRTGGRRSAEPSAPLGSLTQGGVAGRGAGSTCEVCDSTSVTHLTMTLTDGTPARFTSCRRCGERRWDGGGERLSVTEVLARAAKS